MSTISKFVDESHKIAREKGWWEGQRNDGELIALMHSELSEALEAMRNHGSQEDIAEELADCCIRIFDYCGARGIDLQKAIGKKIKRTAPGPISMGIRNFKMFIHSVLFEIAPKELAKYKRDCRMWAGYAAKAKGFIRYLTVRRLDHKKPVRLGLRMESEKLPRQLYEEIPRLVSL